MRTDYRESLAGKRTSKNPEIYRKTVEFQNMLASQGIAWHNPFADECTSDFCCCTGLGNYHTYFPSYKEVVKTSFEETPRLTFKSTSEFLKHFEI